MKFRVFPALVDVLKLMQNLLPTTNFQRREIFVSSLDKNTLTTSLWSKAYEQISFKCGMMVDLISLYSLIPVWHDHDLYPVSKVWEKARICAVIVF